MDKSIISKVMSDMGRRGGKARLTKMTAEMRREIATKASKKAAENRQKKAKARKRERNAP